MDVWIQNILIYVILSALLRGLVSNPSYLGFFQFTSGLILILLLLSPLLSLFSLDEDWYQRLEESLYQIDTRQIERELASSEGALQNVMLQEYEQEIDKQIGELAKEQDKEVERVDVTWSEKEDTPAIEEIRVWLKGQETSREDSIEVLGEQREEKTTFCSQSGSAGSLNWIWKM